MIRHPILLACEALCALAFSAVAQLTPARPPPKPPALHFSLSALGEHELDDGSWQGADLLREPDAQIDRFQLTIRPDQAAQLAVDVVDDAGTQRLYPPPGQDGRLRAETTYALPGPHGFYELVGRAHLRISLRPTGDAADGPLPPALPLAEMSVQPFRLSDGSPFTSMERAFAAPRGASLDLQLRSHQGVVTPTPPATE